RRLRRSRRNPHPHGLADHHDSRGFPPAAPRGQTLLSVAAIECEPSACPTSHIRRLLQLLFAASAYLEVRQIVDRVVATARRKRPAGEERVLRGRVRGIAHLGQPRITFFKPKSCKH